MPGDDDPLERLERARYVSLVTFRRTGTAVATPVWAARRGGRLYAFSESDAGKVKRLRRDPRVRLAPCTVSGRVTGPETSGRAAIVRDAAVERRAYEALFAKYGWQMRLTNLASRLAGRIGRRAVLEIELDA